MVNRNVLAEEDVNTYVTLFRGVTVTIYKAHFALCVIKASNARNFAGETRYIERAILRQQWDIIVLQLWMLFCDTGSDACSLSRLITLISGNKQSAEHKIELKRKLQQIGWRNRKKYNSINSIQDFRTNGIAHMLDKETPDSSVDVDEIEFLFELAVKCYEILTPSREFYDETSNVRIFSRAEQSEMSKWLKEFFDYLSLSCVFVSEVNCVIKENGDDDTGKELTEIVERINQRKIFQRALYDL